MQRWLKDNRGFILFLVCFAFFRTALADWNPVPSGSMRPTLLEGDVVLVNRVAYDFKVPLTDVSLARLGSPQRGDIVTFSSPADGKRLVKRLIAIPGDIVEMRDERLVVNGVEASYSEQREVDEPDGFGGAMPALRQREQVAGGERIVQWLPAVRAMRSFGPVSVPADSYFFLGDNRDNSADSRYIGVVARQLLIGRAHHILVSADAGGSWSPRFERFGAPLR